MPSNQQSTKYPVFGNFHVWCDRNTHATTLVFNGHILYKTRLMN